FRWKFGRCRSPWCTSWPRFWCFLPRCIRPSRHHVLIPSKRFANSLFETFEDFFLEGEHSAFFPCRLLMVVPEKMQNSVNRQTLDFFLRRRPKGLRLPSGDLPTQNDIAREVGARNRRGREG